MDHHLSTALVLGGGGARGAYEAGVLAYLREELEPELGRPLKIDILSGTSVGAINACHVASLAHDHRRQSRDLVARWQGLKVDDVLQWGPLDIVRVLRDLLGNPQAGRVRHRGGLVKPEGLERMVLHGAHWPSIGRNLRSGALTAVALSATHVASGRTVIFIQQRGGGLPNWTRDPHLLAVPTTLSPRHALASAAIPVLFPAVRVRGRLYVDGGLRFDVPLSPALRLGAERVAIVSLRHLSATSDGPSGLFEPGVERAYATAPFLLGKMLNAFLLDRTDQDVNRLRRINDILRAGTAAFGSSFLDVMNGALVPHRNTQMRYARQLLLRPSQDIGKLAGDYARSNDFKKTGRGLAHSTLRRIADREASQSADLVSYLLFDGGFADVLIALGRADARARRTDWIRFWSDAPECEVEAVQLEKKQAEREGR